MADMADESVVPHVAGQPIAPAKRACDACHRRKVKCVGAGPTCKHCQQAGLKCTFIKQPQKKGPKGSRAKVISELRETQRFDVDGSPVGALVSAPGTGTTTSPSPTHGVFPLGRIPISQELIDTCVEYFFENVYPTQPILHRESLQQTVSMMYHSAEAFVFVESLMAYMCIQPNLNLPPHMLQQTGAPNTTTLGKILLEDALETRKNLNYVENATATTVSTCLFFFGCYFCLEKHNTAWYHLREGTTLILILGMHQESSYDGLDPIADMLRRRLFWVMFVTERAYALQTQRPLTLHATIEMPSVAENSTEATQLRGLIHLIHLFKPFDDTFVGLWNQSLKECDPRWIVYLQDQVATALPSILNSTETQAADLRTSQLWLRVMIWQLSISHRLLSSNSQDDALTFRFPINVAREMVMETSKMSQAAMEVHGIGLVSKLFDVACTLVDVMAFVPADASDFSVGPRQYLNHLEYIMSQLRGGTERYLPLLEAKKTDVLSNIPQAPSLRRRLPSSAGILVDELENETPETASVTSIDTPPDSVSLLPKSEYPDPAFEQNLTSVPVSLQYGSSGLPIMASAGYLPTSPGFMT